MAHARCVVSCILVTMVAIAMVGCQEKSQPAPDAAGGEPSGQSVNWSAVQGVTGTAVIDVHSSLSRLLDSLPAGTTQANIRFTDGSMVAGDRAVPATPEQWKGVVDGLKGTAGGEVPIRALPAASHQHNDGLGTVKRNAWMVKLVRDDEIQATLIKALDGESR